MNQFDNVPVIRSLTEASVHNIWDLMPVDEKGIESLTFTTTAGDPPSLLGLADRRMVVAFIAYVRWRYTQAFHIHNDWLNITAIEYNDFRFSPDYDGKIFGRNSNYSPAITPSPRIRKELAEFVLMIFALHPTM